MINLAEWMEIRRLREQGVSNSEIARRLGLNRRTVRRALKEQRPPDGPKPRTLPSKLDPFKDHVRARLKEYDLSAVRLLDEIRKLGYKGGYSILKDLVAEVKDHLVVKAVVRFETQPGGQGQVDWAKFGRVVLDGEEHDLWLFTMILGYSRMRYVEFTIETDTPTFIQCHLNAFAYFGGWPRELLYDNLKQVVLKRGDSSDRHKWNPLFEDFSKHHGFVPRLCQPYRAQTKGKIEANVKYVRGNFFEGRVFTSIQDVNTQARVWLDEANRKPHGTTKVPAVERIVEEDLLRLDGRPPYMITVTHARKVSRECFVSYLGNKYSVPWQHACREALVKVREGKIAVEVAGTVVAVHEERAGTGQVVREKDHFKGLLKVTRERVPQTRRVLVFPDAPTVEERPLAVYDRVLDDFGGRDA